MMNFESLCGKVANSAKTHSLVQFVVQG